MLRGPRARVDEQPIDQFDSGLFIQAAAGDELVVLVDREAVELRGEDGDGQSASLTGAARQSRIPYHWAEAARRSRGLCVP